MSNKQTSAPADMEIHQFSPEEAKELLKTKNIGNRPVNTARVEGYARDMKSGNWLLSGETIIFDENGNIMNGQHRLLACIEAKTPFKSYVVRGVPRAHFSVLDTGFTRPFSQVLEIGHYITADQLQSHAASADIAAVTRMLERYERFGRNAAYLRTGTPTRSEQLAVYNANKLAIEESILQGQRSKKLMPVATGAFLFFVFVRQDADKALQFWQDLTVGMEASLAEDNPAYVLRKKLLDNAASRAKINQSDKIAYAFMAWNAYKANRGIRQLSRRNDQPYPSIEEERESHSATDAA
jgi:hypothetical protein